MSDRNKETPCEPSGKVGAAKYMITTKTGTPLEIFKHFIKELPDRGEGEQMIYELLQEQSYITMLTYEDAQKVAKEPFVDYVILSERKEKLKQCLGPHDADITQSSKPSINSTSFPKSRLTSGQHLRLTSTKEDPGYHDEGLWKDYTFDATLGRGQTIYLLDRGFNLGHYEFRGSREVHTYVVPNRYTLEDMNHRSLWYAENDITDYDGHGTIVASIAAGQMSGVASNANLVLVKWIQTYRDPVTGKPFDPRERAWNLSALRHAWAWSAEDVLYKRSQGYRGKSIICMCYALEYLLDELRHAGEFVDYAMDRALKACWRHDMITVIPAGNEGKNSGSLDWTTPQNLGRSDNSLITVGGVDKHGVLWPETSFDRGISGSMTVYAMAKEAIAADWRVNTGAHQGNGTSLAAPAVAGLAAYFASLPSLQKQFKTGNIARDMKRYIANTACVRRKFTIPDDGLGAYVRVPKRPANISDSSIKVAYNRAPEGLCASNDPPANAKYMTKPSIPSGGHGSSESTVPKPMQTIAQNSGQPSMSKTKHASRTRSEQQSGVKGAEEDDSRHRRSGPSGSMSPSVASIDRSQPHRFRGPQPSHSKRPESNGSKRQQLSEPGRPLRYGPERDLPIGAKGKQRGGRFLVGTC